MAPITKKEIRSQIEESVNQVLGTLEITKASKRTKKLIKGISRKLTDALKSELKKIEKAKAKAAKKLKKVKKVKPKKAEKAKGPKKVEEVVEPLEAQVAS